MKLHILGICGTFMGGLALLARQQGHTVSGSDVNVYPPMSNLLAENDIPVHEGYDPEVLKDELDMVIIGNTLSRGNSSVEFVLNQRIPYISGPQWLAENVLYQRRVIAISGTHGKTTTTAMAAWVLQQAGLDPGFLIGGVAENFGTSARMGGSDYFIVEADEYDTAFFDKRAKFIHYRPEILIINNIEFDHADIFSGIADILREFRRLVAIIPENGSIIHGSEDANIRALLSAGCWSQTTDFGRNTGEWQYRARNNDFSRFDILHHGNTQVSMDWDLLGAHNAANALAVVAACSLIGIDAGVAVKALRTYRSVKRRLEKLAEIHGITVYDDFAHHPTEIAATLSSLRAHVGSARVIAVFEPRSNTMKLGVHRSTLGDAFSTADIVYAYRPEGLSWDMNETFNKFSGRYNILSTVDDIVQHMVPELQQGDQVVIMSNGGFDGIHNKLTDALQERGRVI